VNPVEEATKIISSLGTITANLDPSSKRLIEQRAQRVMILAQRAAGVRSRGVMDAPAVKSTLGADVAALYANSVNAIGRRLRRDCREPLTANAVRAMDALEEPQVSDRQRLEAYERSEAYASECRKLHRHGNRLNVR
jgi:hypothetical protein